MKNSIKIFGLLTLGLFTMSSFGFWEEKLTINKTKVSFFSHTPVEDITAVNYKTVGTLDKQTGEVVFSVPMQSFEFDKALMQKHFNSPDFLDTKSHPKSKFVGKVENLSEINLSKEGSYPAKVSGSLTIKDKSNPINENGTITVKGGKVHVQTKFDVTLADYGITFVKGKPSTNIAKNVTINFEGEF